MKDRIADNPSVFLSSSAPVKRETSPLESASKRIKKDENDFFSAALSQGFKIKAETKLEDSRLNREFQANQMNLEREEKQKQRDHELLMEKEKRETMRLEIELLKLKNSNI